MKLLVLVAHPDDEVIMCGATIAKLVTKGHKVFVTYYTQNNQAFFRKETPSMRVKRAIKEATNSSKFLGYSINFLKFMDMEVEKDKGLLIQETIKEIRRVKPDIIVTHHATDKHIDHRTLGEIVPEANFQSACNLCGGDQTWRANTVLQGEIDLEMTNAFNFQVVSAITSNEVKRKINSFKYYESVKNEHKTESDWLNKKINYVAELRGKAVGLQFGEAFIINNYQPLDYTSIKSITTVIDP